MPPPLRVGVLASGEGTTFEGLARALASDRAVAEIVVLLSDRPSVRALEIARARDIPTVVVPRDGANERRWSDRVSAELAARRVDLVVLAGFLSILPPPWVDRWRGRAVNLHPSLLPRYGGRGMHGRRVHEAVLAAGEEESGVTVHLVTGTVDGGPPVAQERVPVCPGDTPVSLRERLRPVEVALLAATVRRFATGALPLPYPGGEDRAREERARRAARG